MAVLQNPQALGLLKRHIPHPVWKSQLLSERQLLSAGLKMEDKDHREAFQEREDGYDRTAGRWGLTRLQLSPRPTAPLKTNTGRCPNQEHQLRYPSTCEVTGVCCPCP